MEHSLRDGHSGDPVARSDLSGAEGADMEALMDEFRTWLTKALARHTELTLRNGHCIACGMTLYKAAGKEEAKRELRKEGQR